MTDRVTSAKVAEQRALWNYPPTKMQKPEGKKPIRINFVRPLENSQRFK